MSLSEATQAKLEMSLDEIGGSNKKTHNISKTATQAKLDMSLDDIGGSKVGAKGITCHNCGQVGHKAASCPKPKGGGGGGKGAHITCHNCGKVGHKAAHCPGVQSVFERIGGRGGKGGAMSALAEWRKHLATFTDEDGATVTSFYEHPIVRITEKDIQLDTGGSRTQETLTAMNEALHAHTFRVAIKGDEWYVSDGKLRMVRLVDGIVITGAATEYKQSAPPAAALGPARVSRPGGKGHRYAPY